MSSKLYILFCLIALFNTIYSNPTRLDPKRDPARGIDETRWNEDGSDDWKPNPPASIKPPLVPPGEPDMPNCVVSIDHGVYFNNCTNEPSVVAATFGQGLRN